MLHLINEKKYLEAKKDEKCNVFCKIDNFVEDSSIYISGIERGIESSDYLKIQSLAISIKKSANTLGAEMLSDLASRIEIEANLIMTSDRGNLEKLKRLFRELKVNFKKSEEELKSLKVNK